MSQALPALSQLPSLLLCGLHCWACSSRLERCRAVPTPPLVLGAIPKERFLCLGGESVWFVLLVSSSLRVILPFKKG